MVAGGAMAVVFAPIGSGVAYLLGFRGLPLLAMALGSGVLGGYLVWRFSIGVARGAGAALLAVVQPSGDSTPYETEFSQGLALEAADDVEGAIAWFEGALVRSPGDARLRIAFADLCMRQGRHGRAASLYVEARRRTGHRDLELYCTQRVIDLHLGPLGEPARAFPELRRVVDRFPSSREAEGARRALARLKAEHFVAE